MSDRGRAVLLPQAAPRTSLAGGTVGLVDVEILYVAGCPNLEQARRALDAALVEAGVDASVRETEVGDAASAVRVGMRGSPTILVDGVDAVAGGGAAGSLSCRLYPGERGRVGTPSVDQLVEALRR